MLAQSDPQAAERLLEQAQQAVWDRWHRYEQMAEMEVEPAVEFGKEDNGR